MQSLARTIPLLLILANVAACTGGDGAEPVNGMGPGETQAAGQSITQASHSDARNYRLAGDAGSAALGGCSSSFPTSPADADADNIPDELTVITYSNCSEGGITFSGTQTLQDEDTGSAGFDFSSNWDIDASGTSGADTIAYEYRAALTAAGGTSGTFSVTDAARIDVDVDGPSFSGTIGDDHAWDVTFTPDDGVWYPAPGLPLEAGTLSLAGAWDTTVDPDGGSAFGIAGAVSTETPMHTDPSCATSIVSGAVQVVVADPEPGMLLVTWTSCGQTTATFTAFPGT